MSGVLLRKVGSPCHVRLCLPTAPLLSLTRLQPVLSLSRAGAARAQGCNFRRRRGRRVQLYQGGHGGLGVVSSDRVAWNE